MKLPDLAVQLVIAIVAVTPFATGAQELPLKVVVQPDGDRPSPAPLSPAIKVGNTLYQSGATGATQPPDAWWRGDSRPSSTRS